ncbi:carboxymuconolactone decarboxylase family protein [Cohnella abietis]|uniref:Uncharacterized protein n=1 Tax=Cohnella abietis TaxID=2507935 RepID=A0A3T1D0V3_9BACL|nr:carboxymuconolactone decarboxylase family protein [Cohnella abietis]BBI31635.1 hypothetical protein KCTCHS21_10340 [Cohnella abietis]
MSAIIEPIIYENASQEAKVEYERQYRITGTVTNTSKTLLHHVPSYRVYEEWYTLRGGLLKFISNRALVVFAHAISQEGKSVLNTSSFRKSLTDRGEDPDELFLDDEEQALELYGRQLVKDPNSVSDTLFAHLSQYYSQTQIVALTAFAGQTIAVNVFNSALRIELDDYLLHFST